MYIIMYLNKYSHNNKTIYLYKLYCKNLYVKKYIKHNKINIYKKIINNIYYLILYSTYLYNNYYFTKYYNLIQSNTI